jgi:uncharacterized protein involved in exopolysaccharide biosynthesis
MNRHEMTLLDAGEVILSRPRWVFIYPAVAAIVALLGTSLLRPRYGAYVQFAAERLAATGGRATLSGLAGQYGLNVLTDVYRVPAYYVRVLESRHLKEQVLESRVTGDSVRVITLLDLNEGTRAESLAAGVAALTRMSNVRDDPRTGVITLGVQTPDPEASADIAMRYIEALQFFNTTQRRSQARERRVFLEARIGMAQRGARNAQEELRRFYQSNPSWSQRPALAVEGARLRTTFDAAGELASTLEREYELARLEEVTDVPVLTIIDPAVPPLGPSWPRRTAVFVGVLVVGMLVGALAALVADYIARARAQNPEAFARLSRTLRPWQRRE